MKRAATPHEPTSATALRCLHLRSVAAVWGDHEDDHVVARMRWQTAAARSGMGAGGTRYNWHLVPSSGYVDTMLWSHGMTRDDLPALAAEARTDFPDLFDRGWVIAHRTDIDDRERALRLANLAP